MSATLTFASSGLQAKTGTTVAATWTDLVSMFTAQAGNSAFSWAVASSNTGSSPRQVTLKPKGGGAGRIMFIQWDSSPAGNNAAILGTTPSTSNIFVCYFPAGNVDTPSNLTASSGTIMGDDTGVCGAASMGAQTSLYGASIQCFYFDSAETICLGFNNPSTVVNYITYAGNIAVDGNDTAMPGVLVTGSASGLTLGSASPVIPFTTSAYVRGNTAAVIHVNYNGTVKPFFQAYCPSGAWGTTVVGSTDILTDTANNYAWFAPITLLSITKGEGFVLKLRQLAVGPAVVGPFTHYDTTGPVVQARCVMATTAGGASGYPWLTNFKI